MAAFTVPNRQVRSDALSDTLTVALAGTLWHSLALVRQRASLVWRSLALLGTL